MEAESMNRGVAAVLLTVVLIVQGRADEQDSDGRVNEALRVTTNAAKLYEFEVANTPSHRLVLHPNSILRWSNPVAGEVYGNVFVWTHNGRPEVIGSIFQWYSPNTHASHEFHSLTVHSLEGRRDNKLVWSSPEAGITFNPVPDQPAVADTQAIRTRQMRAISRRFQIQKTDREDVTRQLRLLAQPIYRYGGDNSDVVDGSLFVFVQGTDPEVFLIIEARQVGETRQWQYALAQMNSVKFVAKYQDQEIWRTEIWPWSKVKNGRETYTSFGPFEREGTPQ